MSAKCPRSFLFAFIFFDFLNAAVGLIVPSNCTQSNCSIKQRLGSENPMWNSHSR